MYMTNFGSLQPILSEFDKSFKFGNSFIEKVGVFKREEQLIEEISYHISLIVRQNNAKNLDLSYKTELEIWVCFENVKVIL